MFTVTISKTIWNGASQDVATSFASFTRKDSLPFAPMPGIHLYWGNDIEHIITKVVWDFDEDGFACEVAHEFHQSIGSVDYNFEELVQSTTHAGWTLISDTAVEPRKSFWEVQ